MKTITVRASRVYEVMISSGILGNAGEYIKKTSKAEKIMIVSDDNVFPLYGRQLSDSLRSSGYTVFSFVFKNGEQSKNIKTYSSLLETLYDHRFNRNDAVAALGGGVVGDLAGFAAATYQRGIDYVQIPTSLLAAVDSSVGGKTAIDLTEGKNQVGCFYQPSLVLCDTGTLSTLPEKQYRCGCAEIIKYAMIKSSDLFEIISSSPVKDTYEDIIERCVDIKRQIVEQDEFDKGTRMLLNFGHTFGHAAEALSDFNILHGQAVAMGMGTITKSAEKLGCCAPGTYHALTSLLEKYCLPVSVPFSADEIMSVVSSDKKAGAGFIDLVIPKAVGDCEIIRTPMEEVKKYI